MADKCTCSNQCSSNGFKYLRNQYGVSKKLIVAISVIVFFTMCLTPTGAALVEHKRLRLQERVDVGNSGAHVNHKRRHQGSLKPGSDSTKHHVDRQLNSDLYDKARTKIEHKVEYTMDNFQMRRKRLTEPKDYGSGMPTWLPRTNFVDIHVHNLRIGQRNEITRSKKSFMFLVRKLYKSLYQYHELFKVFSQVEVVSPDTEIATYNIKRLDIFTKTTDDLNSTIEDIKDAMVSVSLTQPKLNVTKMKLDAIEMSVDGAKYLKNDEILLRAYGNLLHNWYLELNCSSFVKSGRNREVPMHKCKAYDNSIRIKRKRRRNRRKKLI